MKNWLEDSMKKTAPDVYEEKLEYMSEAQVVEWSEKRFGFVKTVKPNPSNDELQSIESQLNNLLHKARQRYGITAPVPRVRMWLTNDKLNFIFFDKLSGKRILLGKWLQNEEAYYEH